MQKSILCQTFFLKICTNRSSYAIVMYEQQFGVHVTACCALATTKSYVACKNKVGCSVIASHTAVIVTALVVMALQK